MARNGNKFQETCDRGHKLEGVNTTPASNGGRRCVACHRALSTAHNLKTRNGVLLTPEQLDTLADEKYESLVAL